MFLCALGGEGTERENKSQRGKEIENQDAHDVATQTPSIFTTLMQVSVQTALSGLGLWWAYQGATVDLKCECHQKR